MPADSPPLRLFRWDFLERLTHTPVILVPLFWLPVVFLWALKGLLNWPQGLPLWHYALAFLAGLGLVWTFVEYFVHRCVFHSRIRWRWQEEFIYLLHGIHHVQPHTKTRLVLPLTVSIPVGGTLAWLFGKAFGLVGAVHLTYPFLSGFFLDYVAYDCLHYTIHHLPARSGWLKRLKRHHMEHHFRDIDSRYGVTSEMWDHALGTFPESK